MKTKTLGGVLLIIGTSIGGGMLALPISAASSGFLPSSILLISCWLIMTFCALLILEVNLWLPANSNIISMANATIGKAGAAVAWFIYLLLFYSLLSAYISSGTDIFQNFLGKLIGVNFPDWIDSILFVCLLGYVVYRGIRSVDYVNRVLMTTKLLSFALLVICTIIYLHPAQLKIQHPEYVIASLTIMITSFGFATIVPSLRAYYHDDVKKLRFTIIFGSFIPLLCYLIWDLTILGVIPTDGSAGLLHMQSSGHSTTELTKSLTYFLNNSWITTFSHIFTSICVATSFLGVSLGLSDFLADGLSINKTGSDSLLVYSCTFIPPLCIIIFYPNVFIMGLKYAGIFCTTLLIILPSLMAWRGRYHYHFSENANYQVFGGKISLAISIILGILITGFGISEIW